MRVGILSDTHDQTTSVNAALEWMTARGIELVFHCGDIQTVAVAELFRGFQAHFVLGNWDGDWITGVNAGSVPLSPDGRKRDTTSLRRAIADAGGTLHEPWGDLTLDGREIAWIHGDDPKLLDELERSGSYDYLFYGHTHRAEHHRTRRTLVINPGAMFKVPQRTFAALDLERGELESVVVK